MKPRMKDILESQASLIGLTDRTDKRIDELKKFIKRHCLEIPDESAQQQAENELEEI